MKVALLPFATSQQGGAVNKSVAAMFDRPIICISEEEFSIDDYCGQNGYDPRMVIGIKNSYSDNSTDDVIPYDSKAEDVAVIQFSSGSTSMPKGICSTHGNIVETAIALHALFGVSATTDRSFCWLPIHHNLALLGLHITAMYTCGDQYIMSVYEFMANPLKWMQVVSEKSITVTASPNFGYKYFPHFYEKSPKEFSWDLSGLRVIINGAEPISYELCELFMGTLSQYRLSDSVMVSGYGLSETTVAACISEPGTKLVRISIDRSRMNTGDEIELTGDKAGAVFVSVGKPMKSCKARITDDSGAVLDSGTIGNIELSGGNIMLCYYKNPIATKETFTEDGWLKTGDIGMIIDGMLYVTGRLKDIIFIAGKNYFPNDFEKILEDEFAELKNRIAICGMHNKEKETEEILLFIEDDGSLKDQMPESDIRRFFTAATLLQIGPVMRVEKLPRTLNGKVQRFVLKMLAAGGRS
jgi:acyl-CoA synthetase (AMP-forming)/AMP-acid ligase II